MKGNIFSESSTHGVETRVETNIKDSRMCSIFSERPKLESTEKRHGVLSKDGVTYLMPNGRRLKKE